MTDDEKMLRAMVADSHADGIIPRTLTPPDLDVSTMGRGFYMHPRAMLADPIFTSRNDTACRVGMALRLRAWSSVPAASLSSDEAELARWAGVTRRKWESIRDIVLHDFIECEDGRLYHIGLAADALSANRARDRAKSGAGARWKKPAADAAHGLDEAA
jgi:hypothetical protein